MTKKIKRYIITRKVQEKYQVYATSKKEALNKSFFNPFEVTVISDKAEMVK